MFKIWEIPKFPQPSEIQIVFGPVNESNLSDLEAMSQDELFAFYGIRNAKDINKFEAFATEIATNLQSEEEYEDTYANCIRISAGQWSKGIVRNGEFLIEKLLWPSAKLILFPTDQLAIAFGMDAPITEHNQPDFTAKCRAVASNHPLAVSIAKRILSGVKDYHKRYL